jgi:hypothetical protein
MEPFMELSRRERSLRRLIETHTAGVGQPQQERRMASRAELSSSLMRSSISDSNSSLLAPLSVGGRLPWKLDHDGEPQWLVVVDVLGSTSYLVRYPDGSTETLVDSE